jgi:S1-C subfamily serine protease
VTSSGGNRRVIMTLPELKRHQFEALRNQPNHRDAVLCVRARVIQVWPEDDLALVKVPFLTPSHLAFCGNATAAAEPVMMMLNPGMHQGTINPVARKVPLPNDLDFPLKFSTFSPLTMDGLRIIEEGDSGGPVINREGELVGIILASGNASNGRSFDLAVGIQKRPILDAIEKSRKTASAFSRAGTK